VVPPPVPEPPPPDFEPDLEPEPKPDIVPEPTPDIEPLAPDYPDDDPSDPDAYVTWPLPGHPSDTVREWRTGDRTFGADRSNSKAGPHLHAGVDLGPSGDFYGAPVVAPAAGWIDDIDIGFLGPDARRIDIISPVYGRIVLGAVQGVAAVEKGEWVESGQLVGWIGRYPGGSTELHLEQHVDERVKWPLDEPQQPAGLIDPRLGLLAKFPSKSGGGA
jgi:murein DD-endopeptidase MepM/ murein hydrolase activator NlpD